MSIMNATPKAFDLYLEGQRLFSVIERSRLEAAADKFREATRISPRFARAFGYLSYCLAQIVVGGHARDKTEAKELLKQAVKYAEMGVEFDRDDYAPLWDLAFAQLNIGDDVLARENYERALVLFDTRTDRLDRRNDLLVEMAEAFVYAGDSKRAFELLDRAIRVPDWYRWIRAWAHFNAKQYEQAIDEINAMHKQVFGEGYVPDIQLLLAAACAYAGRDKEAQEALDRLKKARPGWTMELELERNPFARSADRDHWREGMRKAKFG